MGAQSQRCSAPERKRTAAGRRNGTVIGKRLLDGQAAGLFVSGMKIVVMKSCSWQFELPLLLVDRWK